MCVDVNDKYKTMYGFEPPYIKDRKYIICCRKFEYISSAAIPCSGQIATNSKLFAKILYKALRKWSYKYYGSMCVMLMKRNEKGTYNAIER